MHSLACRRFPTSLPLQSILSHVSRRFASETAAAEAETMEYPGGRVPFTSSLSFTGGSLTDSEMIPCYRTLDGIGQDLPDADVRFPLPQELAVKMYETMARLQTMDTLFYEAQRQGRFSFYMTSTGEESTVIGSAAALDPKDMIFAQYREQGALLWRGYSFAQFANQCYGNQLEPGKGRQMPIHYGSKELCYQTISSPLATQLPHAVGSAYAMKLSGAGTVSVVYFGEGAASEGDFHAACNFAATLGAPCVFICRNNGYAISTPAYEQYKGDGIAARAPAYGMPAIRVDGGDARAVFNATSAAREMAAGSGRPVLVEAMSYRSGHHSTSDDSSRYRTRDEMRQWRARDPVVRFRNWLVSHGWWDEQREQGFRREARHEVMAALEAAAKVAKPPVSDMFSDVYSQVPWHLQQQRQQVLDTARRHPELCPPDMELR